MKNYHFNKTTKKFFEGWYFKHQHNGRTICLIPGVHMDEYGNRNAFIQVLTNEKSCVINFGTDYEIKKNELFIRIGKNVFCTDYADFNLKSREISLSGKIEYGNFKKIKYDMMGPFALIKNMECNHGIISLFHSLNGFVTLDGKLFSFSGGTGYIEKDWGSSFPETYTWVQYSNYVKQQAFTISVARIPLYGASFTGIIAVAYYKGKEYRLATYNGCKLLELSENKIAISNGKTKIVVHIQPNTKYKLKAPKDGLMEREVQEMPNCTAKFELFEYGTKIFVKHCKVASFEHMQ